MSWPFSRLALTSTSPAADGAPNAGGKWLPPFRRSFLRREFSMTHCGFGPGSIAESSVPLKGGLSSRKDTRLPIVGRAGDAISAELCPCSPQGKSSDTSRMMSPLQHMKTVLSCPQQGISRIDSQGCGTCSPSGEKLPPERKIHCLRPLKSPRARAGGRAFWAARAGGPPQTSPGSDSAAQYAFTWHAPHMHSLPSCHI